jgi:hypothetical protein
MMDLRPPVVMLDLRLPVNPPLWQQQHLQLFLVFKLPIFLRGGQVPLPWAQVKGMLN